MNCRKLAVKILDRVLNGGAYSNIVLSKELNECELNKPSVVTGGLFYRSLLMEN